MSSEPVELRVRIGGEAGFGIKAAGQLLARTFAHEGYEVFDLTEYPSLIRGGHNTYLLRVSTEPVWSHVEPVDVLACLNRETLDRHASEVVDGGAVVFDPDDFASDAVPGRLRAVPVPLTAIARDTGGKIMRNTVALGAVLGIVGFPLEPLAEALRRQFARKAPEVAEGNVAAAQAGYDAARASCPDFSVRLTSRPGAPQRLLVDGNEAIGFGALAAGIGFYAAYPMTPASSLLHFMAAHERSAGVVVKHTEDEIAAMNMVVGAAFGGTRAMCATSGGGFSLMVEAFGMAGVSESAVVVGVFTRPGPATGMPTWTEQSDLRFVIHAAQGEFPRVVLAPGDRIDAFELTWRAFNLADQLQTPVVILGDSYLSDNRQTVPPFDLSSVVVDRGKLIAEGRVEDVPDALGGEGIYLRYKVTDDGVSWRALPGVDGAVQLGNSYEHDERGFGAPGEEAATRVAQNAKRMRKLALARTLVPPPAFYGASPAEADIGLVLFGTTKGPAREAARMLERDGIRVSIMQIVTAWPFPADAVAAYMDAVPMTAVIEGNYAGQLESLIREQTLREPNARLHRYDGRPFAPEQIARFVKEVL
ncbi:MAG: 2-oxoacid:acceptor oxidoreductase subunit alpha [Coriobacteriia bacterium]|nr:2-oxoacid:acceptor oxidoreductase subunit alpha [Coriobacteriia bacterium]